jgi:hypothetical protein
VRPLARAQRHFGAPSQRRIVHGWRGALRRHGVGGARLAQPAAVVGRLLEFAHAVLCAWCISTCTTALSRRRMGVPEDPLDSSPDTFDPERGGRSIVSMVRVPVRTGADILVARSQSCAPIAHLPRAYGARQLPSVELGRRLRLCGHLVWDSRAAVSGVCVAGQRSARAQRAEVGEERVGAVGVVECSRNHRRQRAVVVESRKVQALE